MDPADRKLLERTLKLAEENNDMLLYLRGAERWKRIGWAIKWVVIIGLTVGAYYVIAPYLDAVRQTYSGISGGIQEALKLIGTGK